MRITFPKLNNLYKTSSLNINACRTRYAQNPIHFNAQCSEKNFILKDIPNLHCPVCGLVMLNENQRKTFKNDVASKTGEALIEALTKYEDETALVGDDPKNEHKTIYRPLKAKIIKIIKQAARENPKLNLLQIVRLKRNEFLAPLIKQQLSITAELEEYLETVELKEEERKEIKGIIAEYKSQILGESEIEFKRKNYIHALSNVTDNPEIQERINEIIEQLPQSKNDVNSFFVKYSKLAKSSREIASKFVDQSIPTTEHLQPKSKGGKNNTNNYICDCAECNSARCSTDFDEWLRQKPELEPNLQKYVDQIQQIIDEGNFPVVYDTYVEELIKTLQTLSRGKLKLRIPKSNNKRINDATYAKRAKEIEAVKQAMVELYKRREALKAKINTLEKNSQFYYIVQLEHIKKQIETTEKRLSVLDRDLGIYQQQKQDALDVLEEISLLKISLANGDEEARKSIIELDESTTKAKLEEAEANLKVIQANIKTLTSNLAKLRRKEKMLTKFVVSDDEVEKQIREISEILTNYNSINYRINVLYEQISDEPIIIDAIKTINENLAQIREQNSILKRANGDEQYDRADYEEYMKKVRLHDAGGEIIEYSKQTGLKLPSQTPEIVAIAQETLMCDIEKLFEKDNVRYFLNIDEIKTLEEEKTILEERMAEINSIKKQIEDYKKQAKQALGGKTFEELSKKLESLTQTKNIVSGIKHISEYRTELEIIEDTISYNENILKQLRNFKDMSSEQFQEYINMIFY